VLQGAVHGKVWAHAAVATSRNASKCFKPVSLLLPDIVAVADNAGLPSYDTLRAIGERKVQLEIHRAMTGEQKIALAYEMSMFGRELNRARLRQEHPQWTEAEIARESRIC
jgi:hypothetical protein